MTTNLISQSIGDFVGELGNVGLVDSTRFVKVHIPLLDDATRF
jgi:hypothetical protein